MLISQAFAQTASATQSGTDVITQFLPLILIFVVFYFLLFRPQQKKAKKEREMVSALRRGDKILTKSGFIGTVSKIVNDNEMLVDLGENTRVRMLRSVVAEVLDGASPIGRDSKEKSDDKVEAEEKGEKAESAAEDSNKSSSVLGRLLSKK